MAVKLQSVFAVAPRRSVSERRHCKGCDNSLTPSNRSSDANFCKQCLSTLEFAFTKTAILHRVVEKPIIKRETIVKTETLLIREPFDSNPEKTHTLNESRLSTVQHCILLNERCEGLKIQLEQREVEIGRLAAEVRHLKKQVRRNGRP